MKFKFKSTYQAYKELNFALNCAVLIGPMDGLEKRLKQLAVKILLDHEAVLLQYHTQLTKEVLKCAGEENQKGMKSELLGRLELNLLTRGQSKKLMEQSKNGSIKNSKKNSEKSEKSKSSKPKKKSAKTISKCPCCFALVEQNQMIDSKDLLKRR